MRIEYFLNDDGVLNIKLEVNYLSYSDIKEQSNLFKIVSSKK